MADQNISLSDFQKIAASFKGTDLDIAKIAKELENATGKVLSYKDALTKLGKEATESIIATLKKASETAEDFSKSIKNVDFDKLTASSADLLYTIEPFINVLPLASESLKNFTQTNIIGVDALSNSFKKLEPALHGVLSEFSLIFFGDETKLSTAITKILAQADAYNNYEKSILSLAASTGQLNNIQKEGLDINGSLASEAVKITELSYNVANATGSTMTATLGYASALGHIPGALSENVGSMTELEATMKVATAYGLDYGEVVKSLNKLYTNFGLSGNEAVETLNSMYTAAQKTNMPLEMVKSTIEGISDGFGMFGNNTQAATTVLESFGAALKDTAGVGPQQINQIVKDMTNGVANMSEGMKAFVSAQSGGPGGLAGMFQIDYALQQGNMQEVLSKTMQAMQKQFNAPVVTLEDANKNQALAPELMKQVSYLKDVAHIATSNQEAYRILEAMKTGNVQDMKTDKDKSQIDLKSTIDRGNAIQQNSASILTRIANATELTAMKQAQIEARNMNKYFKADLSEGFSQKAMDIKAMSNTNSHGDYMSGVDTDVGDLTNKAIEGFRNLFSPAIAEGAKAGHKTSEPAPVRHVIEFQPAHVKFTLDLDKSHFDKTIDTRIEVYERKKANQQNTGVG